MATPIKHKNNCVNLHVFLVESNFHYLLSLKIIERNSINVSYVKYIVSRGVRVDDTFDVLYDASNVHFGQRLRYGICNQLKVSRLLRNKKIHYYAPFSMYFPIYHFFDKISFIEEGFSSYVSAPRKRLLSVFLADLLKVFLVFLLLPFSSNKVKGFVLGPNGSLLRSNKSLDYYVCSSNAYGMFDESNLSCIVLNEPLHYPVSVSSLSPFSQILVLDRFSANGRQYSIENYQAILRDVLTYMGRKKGIEVVYSKLHPADYYSPNIIPLITALGKNAGVEIRYINENLEFLASSNNSYTFWGSNSTILYYAPLLGNNKSISYSRWLSNRDEKYNKFLNQWGGIDGFISIFQNNVECL